MMQKVVLGGGYFLMAVVAGRSAWQKDRI